MGTKCVYNFPIWLTIRPTQNLRLPSSGRRSICVLTYSLSLAVILRYFTPLSAPVRQAYIDADVLLAMDDYLDKMPNFKRVYEKQIPYWRAAAPDKKLYYWQGNGVPMELKAGLIENLCVMVRADILELYADKYGWDKPPIYSDEWIEVFRLASEADLKDVDGNKMLGLTGCFGESWGLGGIGQSLGANCDECESAQFSLIEMDKSLVRPPAAAPDVVFSGGRYGTMLTNIYRANISDLVKKTDPDNRMTPTSTVGMPAWGEYTGSIGTWRPDFGRGNTDEYAGIWSRDSIAGIERRRFGLRDLNPKEIRGFDECLF